MSVTPPHLSSPQPHTWLVISIGRVCAECRLAQVKGEFDDRPPCLGRLPPRRTTS